MSEAKITNELLLKMSETDRVKALELLSVLEKRKTQEEAQKHFIKFVEQMWSDFIPGPHHKRMADAFERVKNGELKRLIINLAPRHSKSELTSFLLPAWWLGHFPKDQIMQISHTAELAEGFGRKVRNLLTSDEYMGVFNTRLSRDSTAAARWNTSAGGKYVAMGVGGAVAGLGANLCLAKNSKVKINHNARPCCICNAQVGDTINTVDGWERITNKVLTTHENYYRINSDLKASGEHPFLTRRGWVQAKNLQVGDKILIDSVWRKTWRTIKATLRQTPRANRGSV